MNMKLAILLEATLCYFNSRFTVNGKFQDSIATYFLSVRVHVCVCVCMYVCVCVCVCTCVCVCVWNVGEVAL